MRKLRHREALLRDLRVIQYWKITIACSSCKSKKKGHRLISKDAKEAVRKVEDSFLV